jgi:hypothetical protein
MSIAASVVVQPSRVLLALVGGICLAVAALGLTLACGAIADLSMASRMFWPLLCWLSAGFGLFYMNRGQRIYHLDISGTGQIRLRCRHSHSPPWIDNAEKPATEAGILVTLLADSTMWPGFLMLRLKTGDGYLYNIPILPDSLPRDSFRAISVACRWIAAHEFKP